MAYGFGNRTPHDGLVFYLDAINPSSYTSGSVNWRSIAKDPSSGDFRGNTVFDNNYFNKKAIRFDGSNSSIDGQMGTDNLLDINKTGIITVQIFFSIDSSQSSKWLFSAGSDTSIVQYGIAVSNNPPYGFQPAIYNTNTSQGMPGSDLNLEIYPYRLFTVEFGATTRRVYYDETYVGDHSISHTTRPGDYWYVGDRPGGGGCLNGVIQSIRVYNRRLSSQEISNIYRFYINR